MYEVKKLNQQKKIAYLKWGGIVRPNEVLEANKQLQNIYEDFEKEKFYLIVDITELNVYPPETKVLIVEQQKYFVPKIHLIAEIVKGFLTKKQADEIRKESNNRISHVCNNLEEALKLMESKSIY